MTRILRACVVSILFIACPSSRNATVVADGASFISAILINERFEGKGIALENEWLKAHYPGHTVVSRGLNINKRVPYDVITITIPDETQNKVYFDISKFFGKI